MGTRCDNDSVSIDAEPVKETPLIVYNTTSTPIFITTKWRPDPLGGPAIRETQYCIEPGHGIDLAILGLKPKP